MHVALQISEETILMGSDTHAAFGATDVSGNNISISINTDSKEETDKIYNALAEGGEITMPLGSIEIISDGV